MALAQTRPRRLGREPRLAQAGLLDNLCAPHRRDARRACGCLGGTQHKCREVVDHLRSIIVLWVVPLVDPRGHS